MVLVNSGCDEAAKDSVGLGAILGSGVIPWPSWGVRSEAMAMLAHFSAEGIHGRPCHDGLVVSLASCVGWTGCAAGHLFLQSGSCTFRVVDLGC